MQCMKRDPKMRPSLDGVKQLDWLKKLDWEVRVTPFSQPPPCPLAVQSDHPTSHLKAQIFSHQKLRVRPMAGGTAARVVAALGPTASGGCHASAAGNRGEKTGVYGAARLKSQQYASTVLRLMATSLFRIYSDFAAFCHQRTARSSGERQGWDGMTLEMDFMVRQPYSMAQPTSYRERGQI